MITLTLTAGDGEQFTVRFQNKVLENGAVTWADAEVNHEVGKSQAYGLMTSSEYVRRSVIERLAADGIDLAQIAGAA